MKPRSGLPQLPPQFEELDPEVKARILVQYWIISAELYSMCESNREALIKWINE